MNQAVVHLKKTHPIAKLPEQNNKDPYTGDTGYDLFSVKASMIPARQWAVIDVGLQVAYIEPGYWFRIEGRSGLGFKKHIFPHFGIIDNGYRGELSIKLYNNGYDPYHVFVGDKIAQIIIYEKIQGHFIEVEEIQSTDRGPKGIGSSGQ